jgi:NAD(P)H-dependent flavin oxidoreductase YrpB (nitropropane dioxygenase family)
MWPRTDLLDLLGITHPIIQAPMSGFGGPALVAAVSNAGALGSLSCAALRCRPHGIKSKRYVEPATGHSI